MYSQWYQHANLLGGTTLGFLYTQAFLNTIQCWEPQLSLLYEMFVIERSQFSLLWDVCYRNICSITEYAEFSNSQNITYLRINSTKTETSAIGERIKLHNVRDKLREG